jgi:hypothetical protein
MLHLAAFASPASQDQEDKSKLAVLSCLKWYPELLFAEGYVRDPAGHVIYGSVYKIFLATGDIWALETVHEEIIPLIKNGEVIAEMQYEQQFPHHVTGKIYDDRNFAQIAQLKEDLKEIEAAISVDLCTDGKATKQRTIDAINKLRDHLAPKEGIIIRTGMHSPRRILKIMHGICNQNYYLWSGEQYALYCCEVIGKGEAIATAVDAQRYTKGLANADESTPPDRTVCYYTSLGVPTGLGVSFFLNVDDGIMVPLAAARYQLFGRIDTTFQRLRDYVEQQSQDLARFTKRWQHPVIPSKIFVLGYLQWKYSRGKK